MKSYYLNGKIVDISDRIHDLVSSLIVQMRKQSPIQITPDLARCLSKNSIINRRPIETDDALPLPVAKDLLLHAIYSKKTNIISLLLKNITLFNSINNGINDPKLREQMQFHFAHGDANSIFRICKKHPIFKKYQQRDDVLDKIMEDDLDLLEKALITDSSNDNKNANHPNDEPINVPFDEMLDYDFFNLMEKTMGPLLTNEDSPGNYSVNTVPDDENRMTDDLDTGEKTHLPQSINASYPIQRQPEDPIDQLTLAIKQNQVGVQASLLNICLENRIRGNIGLSIQTRKILPAIKLQQALHLIHSAITHHQHTVIDLLMQNRKFLSFLNGTTICEIDNGQSYQWKMSTNDRADLAASFISWWSIEEREALLYKHPILSTFSNHFDDRQAPAYYRI